MSRAGALRRAAGRAERGMRDVCLIRRESGSTIDDEGREVPTFTTFYGPEVDPHRGQCRIQQGSIGGSSQAQVVGRDQQLLVPIEVQLPLSAPELRVDDEIVMVSSSDPQLAGEVFAVRDLFAKTDASSRRIGVTRRTS